MERREAIMVGTGDPVPMTPEIKKIVDEAFDKSQRLFDELMGKVGESKAVIISELANLVMSVVTRTPPTKVTVDHLAGHLVDALQLDKELVSDYLKRFCETRGLRGKDTAA